MNRTATGQFMRTHHEWTPEHWNDGYVDNKGRFRVYRPDYPGHYPEGYALRAHVVWWLATGEICKGNEKELHHRDGNRLNDVLENLTRIFASEHQTAHHANFVLRICAHCGQQFAIHAWRLKDPSRGKFCDPQCYKAAGGRWNKLTRP